MLRRGRLFTVAIGDGALRPVSAVDAFGPDIDPDGTVRGWGLNNQGQLGYTPSPRFTTPVQVPFPLIVGIAALIVLVLRPESLVNAGFQMSFAAVAALAAVCFIAGCSVENGSAPPLSGPSEFSLSVTMAATSARVTHL